MLTLILAGSLLSGGPLQAGPDPRLVELGHRYHRGELQSVLGDLLEWHALDFRSRATVGWHLTLVEREAGGEESPGIPAIRLAYACEVRGSRPETRPRNPRRVLLDPAAREALEEYEGVYSASDGYAWASAYVSPRMGMGIEKGGCVGVRLAGHGQVIRIENRVLHVELGVGLPGWSRWLLVPWGDDVFLLPEAEVFYFCEQARSHRFRADFFLRRGGCGAWEDPGTAPILPEAYRYLLREGR